MMNIYVGNLSFDTTMDQVRDLFAQYGEVERVYLPADRDTGRPRGFGFVEMPSEDEGRRAIAALDGQEIDGRPIRVNEARPREEGPKGNSSGGDRGNRRQRF